LPAQKVKEDELPQFRLHRPCAKSSP